MTRGRLLVVEDDAALAARIVRGLRNAGYEIDLAVDGELADAAVRRDRFDGVVLDLGLPRWTGLELLERWRDRDLVVVVLTADGELPTRLASFDRGAADFLAKPFFMEELVARIAARLRRPEPDASITWDDVEVSPSRRLVRRGGSEISLTRHELDLLVYLTRREGRPVSRRLLCEVAVLSDDAPAEWTIDSHIAHLRRKLGPAGRAIETVWGVGYRFMPRGRADG